MKIVEESKLQLVTKEFDNLPFYFVVELANQAKDCLVRSGELNYANNVYSPKVLNGNAVAKYIANYKLIAQKNFVDYFVMQDIMIEVSQQFLDVIFIFLGKDYDDVSQVTFRDELTENEMKSVSYLVRNDVGFYSILTKLESAVAKKPNRATVCSNTIKYLLQQHYFDMVSWLQSKNYPIEHQEKLLQTAFACGMTRDEVLDLVNNGLNDENVIKNETVDKYLSYLQQRHQ